MKPTSSSQDRKIIALLKSLGTLKAEYPPELLAARRASFAAQIEEHNTAGANTQRPPSQAEVLQLLQNLKPAMADYPADLLAARRAAFIAQIQEHNREAVEEELPAEEKVIELLGNLKSAVDGYPSNLLAARRAAFIAQIEEHNREAVEEELPAEEKVIELLGNLKPAVDAYPPNLLAARRAAFIAQIRQHNNTGVQQEVLASPNGSIHSLFERLKSIEIRYPRKLWSARRSVFVNQIRDGKVSVLDALRLTIQNLFHANRNAPAASTISFQRVSLLLVTLLVVVFMGSLLYGTQQPFTGIFEPSPAQVGGFYPSQVAAATGTNEVAEVICKPGYEPPHCLAKEFDKSRDLTNPDNGSARPAVAKDTIPGYSRIHRAAYVNDGLYGPGASWISNSAYSWIKIDLGDARTINTIKFGRDRLGELNDGDPGQFIIAVALSDDVYADGNSQNDSMEYAVVYDSDVVGFDGIVSGPETIEATFDPVKARYVKITFENPGTAVDEVEVFMLQPGEVAGISTPRPRNTSVPRTFTPVPTSTLVPSKTATLLPTRTPFPTLTATLRPTKTPRPTDTDVPTDTPVPPTDTPVPPTDTPVPPTDTPEPPTDTPEPPTDTPEPPTDTAEPPSPTPESLSTETPEVIVP